MSGRKSFHQLTGAWDDERKARVASKVAALREEMAIADIRKTLGISQKDLAAGLSTTQPAVAQMENRDDMYVSNLRRVVEALGGTLEISATFPNGAVRIVGLGEKPTLSTNG